MEHSIQELKDLFEKLSLYDRGTSGRIILDQKDENKMKEIIEFLFIEELSKEQ